MGSEGCSRGQMKSAKEKGGILHTAVIVQNHTCSREGVLVMLCLYFAEVKMGKFCKSKYFEAVLSNLCNQIYIYFLLSFKNNVLLILCYSCDCSCQHRVPFVNVSICELNKYII